MGTAETGTLWRIVSTRMPTKWGMFDVNAGVEVVARIPCEAPPNPHSFAYLRPKKEKLGHTLTLHMECPA
jgi:hypothetical protein